MIHDPMSDPAWRYPRHAGDARFSEDIPNQKEKDYDVANALLDRCSDLRFLHPIAARDFNLLAVRLAAGLRIGSTLVIPFHAFETYRTPHAQDAAFTRGVSKAKAFQSSHQFGLAVDFVPKINGKWTWAPPGGTVAWDALDAIVKEFPRLSRPISWDRPHIEHRFWNEELRWRMNLPAPT